MRTDQASRKEDVETEAGPARRMGWSKDLNVKL